MISPDAFYEQVNSNFNQLFEENKNLLEKIHIIKEDLCQQINETSKKIDDFTLVAKTLDDKHNKKIVNSDRKFYVIIGIVSVITSSLAIFY